MLLAWDHSLYYTWKWGICSVFALFKFDETTDYVLHKFCRNIRNIWCVACTGPQCRIIHRDGVYVHYMQGYSWMEPLAILYIDFAGISLIYSGLLAWATAFIIYGDGVYFRYVHCVSWMGQLAILYIDFAGISLIYSGLLEWATVYIIHGAGVYVRLMKCDSLMGPLALYYIHFSGISLIYSGLLIWDHSPY